MPPDPATRLSGWPHWVTIPPKLESAFYSAGKYSVGTNGVLRKLKHIFPNTYQSNKYDGPPPALLTSLGVMQRMTAEPRYWGGVSHPLQLTTGLVIKSITTSPTFGR